MINRKILCALVIGMIAVPCAVYIGVSASPNDGPENDLYRHDVWEQVYTFVGIERVNSSHLAINYLYEIATRNETTGGADISYRVVKTEIYDMREVNITVEGFYSNNIDPRTFGIHYFYHYYDNISPDLMFKNTNYESRHQTYSDQLPYEQGIIDNITIPDLIWTPETEALFQHDWVMAWVSENGTTVQKLVEGQLSQDENGSLIFAESPY